MSEKHDCSAHPRRGFVPPSLRVHSANSSARRKMELAIERIERIERFARERGEG